MIAEQAKRCMNMVLLEKLRFAQQKPLLVLWPSGWPPRIRLLRGCRQCLASRDYTQLWTPKPRTPSTAMKVDFAAHLTDKTFLVFRSRDSSFGVQVVKVVNSTSCYHMLHQVEFVHLMKLKVLWDIFPEVLKVKSINTSAKLPDRVYFGFEVQGPIINNSDCPFGIWMGRHDSVGLLQPFACFLNCRGSSKQKREKTGTAVRFLFSSWTPRPPVGHPRVVSYTKSCATWFSKTCI